MKEREREREIEREKGKEKEKERKFLFKAGSASIHTVAPFLIRELQTGSESLMTQQRLEDRQNNSALVSHKYSESFWWKNRFMLSFCMLMRDEANMGQLTWGS